MKRKQVEELENCLAYLEAGASLEDCFQHFPDLTPEMKKILATASHMLTLSEGGEPSEAMIRSRNRVLARSRELIAIEDASKANTGIGLWLDALRQFLRGNRIVSRIVLVLGVTVVLILFSGGLVMTSAKSLPGDSLYPVKRAVEDISIRLVPSGAVRNQYEENYDRQRVSEVVSLLEIKRIEQISFEGILQSQDGDIWMVSAIPVIIGDQTHLINAAVDEKAIQIGDVLEVEGFTDDHGWVTANEIHLREYQLNGTVDTMSSRSWSVAGIQLLITQDTEIETGIELGDKVIVGVRSEDDSLSAISIQRVTSATETPERLPSQIPSTEEPAHPEEDDYKFVGTVEQINHNDWVVGGKTFYLTSDTHLPGEVNIGDSVEIKFHLDAGGAYIAAEIERIESLSPTLEYQTPASTDTEHDGEHQVTPTVTPSQEYDDVGTTQTPTSTPTPKPTEDD